ncbi:hypothetical protein COR50_01935 [Chitinophaga caeni]|uniref:HTH luxR-type domain-containing protein n=1 Tax=Chitinophaga caeni TaxID=2029983 RepID=A0A291QPU8_9BACT|nr:response regulator transcription factor [Chitinophaga caeni]ATL46018.1 hypothetical protein COR50_01935 [Chitinophaga caeni]
MRIKVAIFSEQWIVIHGLSRMLSFDPSFELVASGLDGQALLRDRQILEQVDVFIWDGEAAVSALVGWENPVKHIKIVLLSRNYNKGLQHHYGNVKVDGFIHRNCDDTTLHRTIREVHRGEFPDNVEAAENLPAENKRKPSPVNAVSLTKRERQVLKLITEEFTNQEIADQLCISLRTVETHRLNMTQKLAVKNTAGLVKEAIRMGLSVY